MDRNTLLRFQRASRRRRGFTLVEMLVVSALIALFAGLAVFSITTQLEQNKKKAAVAECRQIATAMNFAQQDLGFFPKLCLLKFNYDNLIAEGARLGFSDSAVEYHSHLVPQLTQRLKKDWRGVYMTSNVDRQADMTFSFANQGGGGNSQATMKWPADPWGRPYVAYLLKMTRGRNAQTAEVEFIEKATEDPNFFAGVVSYGRDGVPGLGEDDYLNATLVNDRKPYRLFKDIEPTQAKYQLLDPAEYNAASGGRFGGTRVDMFIEKTTPAPDGRPRALERFSSDRVYQF